MVGGRRLRTAVLPALLTVALLLPGQLIAQDFLYVASQEGATVSVIDMEANEVVETVDLTSLGFSPTAKAHHTAVEPDGSFWYVSLIADGKVLKFDRQNRLVGQADFETPGMLALDPTSDLLYVGRSMAAVNPPQQVGMLNRTSMEMGELDVFFARPHALAVDPQGGRVFSASLAENRIAWAPIGEEEVDLFDVAGMMNHMFVQFAVSPDGHWMTGGGQMTGDMLVFDLSGDEPRLDRSFKVGSQPWHPVFTPDGSQVWVPNQTGNSVTVIDTDTWSIVDVIEHPALAQPHGSAVSPDGQTVYVSGRNIDGTYHAMDGSDGRPGTVVAIDVASRMVKAVIEVGPYAAGMSAPAGG